MRIFIIILMSFVTHSVFANVPMSYVRVIEPYTASKAEPAAYYDLSRTTTTYFDGLGRAVETVAEGAGGDFENVATLTEYGRGGAVTARWQPVGVSSSGFAPPTELKSAARAFYGCTNPCTNVLHDLSEDLRPSAVIRPNATVAATASYDFCKEGEIPLFNANGPLERHGFYSEGSLRSVKNTDETGLTQTVYTDFSGRQIAKSEGGAWTFWVYDINGRLRFAISPEGARRLTADGICDKTVVEDYCSEYHYDSRGRLVESRVAGVAPVLYVYDRYNRLVAEQDGHLRSRRQWRIYGYDSKMRLAVTGVVSNYTTSVWTREELAQKYADAEILAEFDTSVDKDMNMCYRLNNAPSGDLRLTHAYYYDTYDFWTSDWQLPGDADYGFEAASRMGKPTGCAVMGSCDFPEFTVFLYDRRDRERARCRRQYTAEFIESTFTDYNYIGQPVRQRSVMSFPYGEWQEHPDETRIDKRYSYMQDGGKPYAEEISVDGGAWERVYYDYDSAGRLVAQRGGSAGKTGYTLDAEARILAISNANYKEELSYAPNGLISGKTVSQAFGGETFSQSMEYGYDNLRRLTAAVCSDSNFTPYPSLFTEAFDYDLNGNITMLRRGIPAAQDFESTYKGNRIVSLSDSSTPMLTGTVPRFKEGDYDHPYDYDDCARITADRTRGIASVAYNAMHRPVNVTMDNGNELRLRFNANGVKESEAEVTYYVTTVTRVVKGDTVEVRQKRAHTTVRNYYGCIQRVGGATNRLEWLDGYFIKGDDRRWHSYRYVRNLLGSIVAVCDSAGVVVQSVGYFASGLPVVKTAGLAPATRRMHVGKEFEQFESIFWYDNAARFLDALTMRFIAPDQLADIYPSTSSYVYCLNNPVSRVDINGMNDYEINEKGEITLKNETNDKTDTIYGKSRFDGKETKSSITLEKNFLASRNDMVLFRKNNNEKDEKDVSMFSGSASESIEFFEFVAANSDVEWSNVLYEENGVMKGVVGTTYDENLDFTIGHCLQKLSEEGLNVIEANHSHGGKDATSVVSNDDIDTFKKHFKIIPNIKMNIFVRRGDSMRYKPFDQNSEPGKLDETEYVFKVPAKKR